MNIFMTNDDGFDSPLLLGLAKTLSKNHSITIVAPSNPQSGASHSLTMHKPLRVKYCEELSKKTNTKIYSCSGKPADCVKLGLDEIVTKEEINKARKAKALLTHPDRNPNIPDIESKFDEVTKAYKTLLDYCQNDNCSFKEEDFEKNSLVVKVK